jgi:fructose-1-phosphate kinase PfkB-like protein
MLAGLVWAAARQCSPAECLAWGAACGAASAAVWDPGGIQLEHVRALLPAVRVVPA